MAFDTHVLVSALRSNRGALHALMRRLGDGQFRPSAPVPLVLDDEDALLRQVVSRHVTQGSVQDVLDYLCAVSKRHKIHCLCRAYLCEATDDMVLELALAAQCEFIVAHHLADFKLRTQGAQRVMSPQQFLQSLKECK